MSDPTDVGDVGDVSEGRETGGRVAEPGGRVEPGMPRWVKGFVIAAAVLVVLFVALQVLGGGSHGPQRHSGAGIGVGAGAGSLAPIAGALAFVA